MESTLLDLLDKVRRRDGLGGHGCARPCSPGALGPAGICTRERGGGPVEGGGRRGVFWRVAWRKSEGGEGLEASGAGVAVAGRGILDSELLGLAGRKPPRRGGLGQACWAAGRQ